MSRAALVVADDQTTLDDVLRLAVAADVEVTVARSVTEALPHWTHAPLVLVGADAAAALARGRPPRRSGVVVLAAGAGPEAGDPVYRAAVELGAQEVVVLAEAEAETWLVEALATAAEPSARPAVTVGVMGGRGGAGASVLASMFAVVAADDGLGTLLIDVDPYGGGLDLLLGRERQEGVRWPDLAGRRGRLSGAALCDSLPAVGPAGPRLLSWHRGDCESTPPAVMRSVLHAASRRFELVVLDLPRVAEPGTAPAEAVAAADVVLLVVTTELRAVAAARQVARRVLCHVPDTRLVVRATTSGQLTAATMAEALDLPLAGVVRSDRRLPPIIESGELAAHCRRGPLPALCRALLDDLRPWPVPPMAEEAA